MKCAFYAVVRMFPDQFPLIDPGQKRFQESARYCPLTTPPGIGMILFEKMSPYSVKRTFVH